MHCQSLGNIYRYITNISLLLSIQSASALCRCGSDVRIRHPVCKNTPSIIPKVHCNSRRIGRLNRNREYQYSIFLHLLQRRSNARKMSIESDLPVAESRAGVGALSSAGSLREPRPPNGSADDVGNMPDGGGNKEKALDM